MTAEILDLSDGVKALVRHAEQEPTPNAPIPVYIGLPLLGQRVELELRRIGVYDADTRKVSVIPSGTIVRGVCVAIHRSNGVVVIAPCARRREDGSWATHTGPRLSYVREEILAITVDDKDKPRT